MTSSPPLISFIIVNYRVADKVERAVRSIGQHCLSSHEIIVVDNSDHSDHRAILGEHLRELPAKLVDPGRNGGFGAGCNVGTQHATGEYLFFLNPDAALTEDSPSAMAATLAKDPSVGALGCKVVNENHKVEVSFGEFITIRRPMKWAKHVVFGTARKLLGRGGSSSPSSLPKAAARKGLLETQYVTGAALMMPRAVFQQLHGFDESFFMYAEETDLQYRMSKQLGLRTQVDLDVSVFHENGGTYTVRNDRRCSLERGCYIFIKKHHGFLYTKTYKVLTIMAASVEVLASPVFSDYSARDNIKLWFEVLNF